jgi:hypothetical protein
MAHKRMFCSFRGRHFSWLFDATMTLFYVLCVSFETPVSIQASNPNMQRILLMHVMLPPTILWTRGHIMVEQHWKQVLCFFLSQSSRKVLDSNFDAASVQSICISVGSDKLSNIHRNEVVTSG